MKKLAAIICLCTIFLYAKGQRTFSLPFSSSYDENATILVGLQYNYVNQNYQLNLKKNWQSQYTIDYPGETPHDLDYIKSIHSKNSHGFSVGIPIDIRANENLYFTVNPSFLFVNNSGIVFSGSVLSDNELLSKTMTRRSRHLINNTDGTNFNSFEFPISVKFRSDEKTLKNKFNRYRAYLIGGARYARFIGINSEYEALLRQRQNGVIPQSLILQSGYLSWEAGLGLDIFFPYFKMSPEVKFNQSFNSVLDPNHPLSNGNKFMAPIDKAFVRNIYVSLIFQ